MTPDKRIDWCREFIPGFAEIHDQAEKARMETEENRKQMAVHMLNPTYLANYLPKKEDRAA